MNMAGAHKQARFTKDQSNNESELGALITLQDYLCDAYPVLSSRMVAKISKYVEKEFDPKKKPGRQK